MIYYYILLFSHYLFYWGCWVWLKELRIVFFPAGWEQASSGNIRKFNYKKRIKSRETTQSFFLSAGLHPGCFLLRFLSVSLVLFNSNPSGLFCLVCLIVCCHLASNLMLGWLLCFVDAWYHKLETNERCLKSLTQCRSKHWRLRNLNWKWIVRQFGNLKNVNISWFSLVFTSHKCTFQKQQWLFNWSHFCHWFEVLGPIPSGSYYEPWFKST